MEKETVVVFLDYANIQRSASEKQCTLDYQHLLHYMGEARFLIEAYCYVPINPRSEHRLDGVIDNLWRAGYIVTTKVGTIAGVTYKCNFDVEITMDVLRVVYQVKPDIIVLASGDSDFVSLIQEVRKSGVRIEVAAFEETAGTGMMNKCSGFIDLAVYYDSYVTAQNSQQEGIEERYKNLIQSQQAPADEDGISAQDQDLLQPRDSDLDDDDIPFPIDQPDKQTSASVSDLIDELDL